MPIPTISLRYWAGARAAAGIEQEGFPAASIADALAQARSLRPGDERFSRVLTACSVLVEGVVVHAADLAAPCSEDLVADVLPPFAGGA